MKIIPKIRKRRRKQSILFSTGILRNYLLIVIVNHSRGGRFKCFVRRILEEDSKWPDFSHFKEFKLWRKNLPTLAMGVESMSAEVHITLSRLGF